jgi:hypothetical protein
VRSPDGRLVPRRIGTAPPRQDPEGQRAGAGAWAAVVLCRCAELVQGPRLLASLAAVIPESWRVLIRESPRGMVPFGGRLALALKTFSPKAIPRSGQDAERPKPVPPRADLVPAPRSPFRVFAT